MRGLAEAGAAVPMLAHTHGQPATPVTVGKEMAVFAHRLSRQITRVEATQYLGKINGATGTWAAHVVSVPGADWPTLARSFVEGLGLTWNPLTTQIESHDWQAELYADVARAGRIAHNLATDAWTYISMDYFHQNLAAQGSTGSSTMPHKVNPIRFENAEANLEVSNALLDSLGATLVTSRMQRDLTDSTTQRNVGVALGHSLLAVDNIRRGLAGLDVDRARLEEDLEATWEVLGEPVQQAMRAASVAGATGMADPYERLKELTRGKKVTPEAMREFISGLGMPDDVEARLLAVLDDPGVDPFGNPIPEAGDQRPAPAADEMSVEEARRRGVQRGVIKRLGEPVQAREEVFTEINKAGITPGVSVNISTDAHGVIVTTDAGARIFLTDAIARHAFIFRG